MLLIGIETVATQQQISLFAQTYSGLAQQAGTTLGVAPTSILSQWALESGYGTSNAAQNYNLGGIQRVGGGNATYGNPQEFLSAYVSTVKNHDPQALNTGSDMGAFVNGLGAGHYYGDQSASSYGQGVSGAAGALQTAAPDIYAALSTNGYGGGNLPVSDVGSGLTGSGATGASSGNPCTDQGWFSLACIQSCGPTGCGSQPTTGGGTTPTGSNANCGGFSGIFNFSCWGNVVTDLAVIGISLGMIGFAIYSGVGQKTIVAVSKAASV